MQGPIYKFFRLRPTEAYYALGPAEREALLAKIAAIGSEQGIKVLVVCDSGWNNEAWGAWGVEEYTDMDHVARHNTALVAADWFRYIESETMLGTAMPQ